MVVLDTGGIDGIQNKDSLANLLQMVDIIKPNEHEVRYLTDVEVTDLNSARDAGAKIQEKYGIQKTIITVGADGAYYYNNPDIGHFKALQVESRNTTGCGDQFISILCCHLQMDRSKVEEAIRYAIVAAVIQAEKTGIEPVTREEVNRYGAYITNSKSIQN